MVHDQPDTHPTRANVINICALLCGAPFSNVTLFRYNRGGGGYNNRNQGFNNRNNHGGYNRNHNPNRSLPSNQSGSGKSDSRLNQSDIEPVSGSFKKTPKKEEPVKVPTSLVNYEGSDDEDEDGLKECYYFMCIIIE